MYKLFSTLLLSITTSTITLGQTHMDYTIGTEAAVGTGDYTAYQVVTNRFSELGVRSNTANMRADIEVEHAFSDKYVLSGKVDAIASIHSDHKAYLQQCYANMKLNHFFIEAGMREIEPVMRSRALSAGDFTESGNAKPIPQVRIGTDGFWTVPYTKGWLELYFDASYGHYIDDNYCKSIAEEYTVNGKTAFYTDQKWYHHKQIVLRSNSSKPLFIAIYANHAVQFGGVHHALGYEEAFPTDLTPSFKDFFRVIMPRSDQSTGQWISGNHLGQWTIQVGWNINKEHQLQAYMDNIFEDGSGIRKGNGWDGIWGLEYRNKKKGFQYLRGAVVEYIQTTHQSGYIHWDHEDYQYPYNSIKDMQDLVTGTDNYYNNYFYLSYTNYGMAQGNALLMSPIYNKDGFGQFTDNSIKAIHMAATGDLYQGRKGNIDYLVRGSYRKGYGTHYVPFAEPSHSFDAMVQMGWNKGPWKAAAAIAIDRGNIYGNTNTLNLKIAYHGRLF